MFALLKKFADIFEKFGIGSLLIGLYQLNGYAVILGLISVGACLYITWRFK